MKQVCRILLIVTVACSASLGLSALVTEDPPDSEVNPQTSEIETADAVLGGDNQDIRYVIDAGTTYVNVVHLPDTLIPGSGTDLLSAHGFLMLLYHYC